MHKSKEVAGCHLGHKSARKCKSTELASLRVRKSEKSQTGRMGARRFENLGHPIRRGERRGGVRKRASERKTFATIDNCVLIEINNYHAIYL